MAAICPNSDLAVFFVGIGPLIHCRLGHCPCTITFKITSPPNENRLEVLTGLEVISKSANFIDPYFDLPSP